MRKHTSIKSSFTDRIKDLWPIIAIVLFSLVTRLYKINANLPNTYWHDENNYVETALRFGTGNFRPQTLQHGMLLPIILFIEYAFYFLISKVTGAIHNPADYLNEYIKDPTVFFMISRLTVVAFSIACVILVYFISLRLFNRRAANLSSLLFSVALVPFIQSKWTKAAMVSTFFLLFALFLSLNIFNNTRNSKKPVTRYYILSGFFVGLAAAAKLYSMFGFVFIVNACLFSRGHERKLRMLIFSALSLAAGFLAGNPYVIADPGFFYKNVLELNNEIVYANVGNPWLVYFTSHLKNAVGSRMLEVLILASCAYFIFKRSKKELFLLAYPTVMYLACVRYPGFTHYLVPSIPFLAIITGSFMDILFARIQSNNSRYLAAFILCIAIIPCFLNIFRYNALISDPDTRTSAKDWIEKNIPQNNKLLSEGYILSFPVQVPQLKGNLETLERDLALVVSSGGKGFLIKREIEYAKNDSISKRYGIYKTKVVDIPILEKTRADYVVLSGYVDMDAGEREYLRAKDFREKRDAALSYIGREYTPVKIFSPNPVIGSYFPLLLMNDFKQLESIGIFKGSSGLMQGPEIRIFRKKGIMIKEDVGKKAGD